MNMFFQEVVRIIVSEFRRGPHNSFLDFRRVFHSCLSESEISPYNQFPESGRGFVVVYNQLKGYG